MLASRFPRPPGDIGHPDSFPFPVLYRRVEGASPDRVVRQRAIGLLEAFIAQGRALADDGVCGISTSCGFLALFQQELAAALPVPVLSSALCQVAMINGTLPKGRRAGVLTISTRDLSAAHLAAAHVPRDTPVGSPSADGAFVQAILSDAPELDIAAARAEMVTAAKALQAAHPDLGAIVLECTNMGPYAPDIIAATGLPCYSILTALRWFHAGLQPPEFR